MLTLFFKLNLWCFFFFSLVFWFCFGFVDLFLPNSFQIFNIVTANITSCLIQAYVVRVYRNVHKHFDPILLYYIEYRPRENEHQECLIESYKIYVKCKITTPSLCFYSGLLWFSRHTIKFPNFKTDENFKFTIVISIQR